MTTTAEPGCVAAYGFIQPTAEEARRSLERIYGAATPPVWAALVQQAGVAPLGTFDVATEVARLTEAFLHSGDPVVALCGRALQIRVDSYRHLTAAMDKMEDAS